MDHVNLRKLKLQKGAHLSREEGMCVMEAVAYYADEKHTDSPKCAHPILASVAMTINDAASDADRQKLKRFIPLLVGTRKGGKGATKTYAFAAATEALHILRRMGKLPKGVTFAPSDTLMKQKREELLSQVRGTSSKPHSLENYLEGMLWELGGKARNFELAIEAAFAAIDAADPPTKGTTSTPAFMRSLRLFDKILAARG